MGGMSSEGKPGNGTEYAGTPGRLGMAGIGGNGIGGMGGMSSDGSPGNGTL